MVLRLIRISEAIMNRLCQKVKEMPTRNKYKYTREQQYVSNLERVCRIMSRLHYVQNMPMAGLGTHDLLGALSRKCKLVLWVEGVSPACRSVSSHYVDLMGLMGNGLSCHLQFRLLRIKCWHFLQFLAHSQFIHFNALSAVFFSVFKNQRKIALQIWMFKVSSILQPVFFSFFFHRALSLRLNSCETVNGTWHTDDDDDEIIHTQWTQGRLHSWLSRRAGGENNSVTD